MMKEGVDSSGGRSNVDALVACRGLLKMQIYQDRCFLVRYVLTILAQMPLVRTTWKN